MLLFAFWKQGNGQVVRLSSRSVLMAGARIGILNASFRLDTPGNKRARDRVQKAGPPYSRPLEKQNCCKMPIGEGMPRCVRTKPCHV